MASPNAQPDISADNAPPPRHKTSTPGVVNDGWDLHMEWVFNSFTCSQMELMNELVPDMLQAQCYRNVVTLRQFWAFVYRQFDDIYPACDWTEWTTEEDLRVTGMEHCVAIHFYMLMEGMHGQGLIRTGRDQFVEGAQQNTSLALSEIVLVKSRGPHLHFSPGEEGIWIKQGWNWEQILAGLAEKYQGTKQLLNTSRRLPKARTDEQKCVHARHSTQSYQKNREVILEWHHVVRLAKATDSNESTVPEPLLKKHAEDPAACWQDSMTVHSNPGNLPFWLRRSSTLEGRLATLLNRRIPAERNTGMWDLNDIQLYDCPKAQYVECIYREFCFLFHRDGTYNDNKDSVFEPRVEEMDALSTHVTRCVDAILNIDGYGPNYLKADGLAAEVTMVGGWMAELEIEAMNDPEELVKLHHERQLMYQM
ncbi:hypothetical protein EV421DRAFT_1741725 [Armillaria borealis]|uniref:Uncharacterized protein n=1 Tax=Armillaria borealis TaxID=47425 RepID=A0AA39MGW3_9AGAR|nr:hypothetical protein EV421DRAFT_1741725 [Armillaria borealis]